MKYWSFIYENQKTCQWPLIQLLLNGLNNLKIPAVLKRNRHQNKPWGYNIGVDWWAGAYNHTIATAALVKDSATFNFSKLGPRPTNDGQIRKAGGKTDNQSCYE